MDSSPLQRLPAELRCNIYKLTLPFQTHVSVFDAESSTLTARATRSGGWPNKDITVSFAGKHGRFAIFPHRMEPHAKESIAVLLTCRQIQEEALPIFSANNKFCMRPDSRDTKLPPCITDGIFHPLGDFLDLIRDRAVTQVHLWIDLGGFTLSDSSESSRDVNDIRPILKYMASKKPENLGVKCLTCISIVNSQPNHLRYVYKVVTVDAWHLRQTLPAAGDAVASYFRQQHVHASRGDRVKALFEEWVQEDWTA